MSLESIASAALQVKAAVVVVPSIAKPQTRAAASQVKISFILPVLNEAALIQAQLQQLQIYRDAGHEVLLIDGGSADGTVENAAGLTDRIEISQPGRSVQMNLGAQLAQGEFLLFLHIDTSLPARADRLIDEAIQHSHRQWGWFDVRLSNPTFPYRLIAAAMNLRARWSAVCTGDQALFVEARLFHRLGGFPSIPLMEDVAISKLLRRSGRPVCIRTAALTSARRWEQQGLLKTMALMWWLRLQYFLGVSPLVLVKKYYPPR